MVTSPPDTSQRVVVGDARSRDENPFDLTLFSVRLIWTGRSGSCHQVSSYGRLGRTAFVPVKHLADCHTLRLGYANVI